MEGKAAEKAVVGVLNFLTYRLFISNFLPGMLAEIVVAFYLRDLKDRYTSFFEQLYALREVTGGALIVLLLAGLAIGISVVLDFIGSMVFGRLTNLGPLRRLLIKLPHNSPGQSEKKVIEEAKKYVGRSFEISEDASDDQFRSRLSIWLARQNDMDFDHLQRYLAGAILCRSVACILVGVMAVELSVVQHEISGSVALLGVGVLVSVMLSAFAFAYHWRRTLEIGRQRLSERATADYRQFATALLANSGMGISASPKPQISRTP